MRAAWVVLAALGMAACGPEEWRPPSLQDSHEDPAKLRPGYGNEQVHTWWPLTDVEVATLQNADKARQGDAHALLAFAILGSGVVRDAAGYARITQRFDAFLEHVRPSMDAETDQAKRGDLLNHAMHEFFFTGPPNATDPSIGSYDADQARLTEIFARGTFNCVSSALLYVVAARAFQLPVRGVFTKNHAFVELDPEGTDRRIDVETTNPRGFGEVHDAAFYARATPLWKKLGLDPMTYDDYAKREVVSPYVFVARAMNDKRLIDDGTEGRLFEGAAVLAPDDELVLRNRLAAYVNESKWLFDHKASRTTLRLVETVSPIVSDIPNHFASDKDLMRDVAWMAWYDAEALLITGHGDEAVPIADEGLDHVDSGWEDAKLLRNDFVDVLLDRMTELQADGQYEKSVDVVRKHIDACRADDACLNNLYLTFDGWCVKHQLAKDWPRAKKDMQVCIALLPDDTRCHHTLEGLNRLHP